MKALERVLQALGERVKLRRPDGWTTAQCPAHEDRTASLGVKQGDKGAVLKCQAGCKTEDVVKAINLRMGDLFDEEQRRQESRIVATYGYRDETGKILYEVVRFEPKDFRQRQPNGVGWTWNLQGVRHVLYCLPQLLKSAPKGVFIVEGEKDVDALFKLGLIATTNAGGAGKWRPEYTEQLKGRNVVILPDNDDAGRKHADLLAGSLTGNCASCRVVNLPGLPPKGDVSDWITAGGTKEKLLALCKAPPKNPLKARLEAMRSELDAILGGL